MTTPVEQLRAAKALIDTPEKWTREAFARSASGRKVESYSRVATCFCAVGAANAKFADGRFLAKALGRKRARVSDVFAFNDDPATTHADVMALFDRAITLAEQAA